MTEDYEDYEDDFAGTAHLLLCMLLGILLFVVVVGLMQ